MTTPTRDRVREAREGIEAGLCALSVFGDNAGKAHHDRRVKEMLDAYRDALLDALDADVAGKILPVRYSGDRFFNDGIETTRAAISARKETTP